MYWQSTPNYLRHEEESNPLGSDPRDTGSVTPVPDHASMVKWERNGLQTRHDSVRFRMDAQAPAIGERHREMHPVAGI